MYSPFKTSPMQTNDVNFNPNRNYKGELYEMCTRRKWTVPSFNSYHQGPDHDTRFSSTVTIIIDGVARTGKSQDCKNKVTAEHYACYNWLAQHSVLNSEHWSAVRPYTESSQSYLDTSKLLSTNSVGSDGMELKTPTSPPGFNSLNYPPLLPPPIRRIDPLPENMPTLKKVEQEKYKHPNYKETSKEDTQRFLDSFMDEMKKNDSEFKERYEFQANYLPRMEKCKVELKLFMSNWKIDPALMQNMAMIIFKMVMDIEQKQNPDLFKGFKPPSFD